MSDWKDYWKDYMNDTVREEVEQLLDSNVNWSSFEEKIDHDFVNDIFVPIRYTMIVHGVRKTEHKQKVQILITEELV